MIIPRLSFIDSPPVTNYNTCVIDFLTYLKEAAMSFGSFLNEAASVKPSARQLSWFDTEFYAFVHFSPNTYTGLEWGTGKEDPSIFAPAELDCDQWCEAILSAGMKGMILTAKHHDGFCLWPSAYTDHCVKNAAVPVDVVKTAADACRRHGLKFGFYLSPWDRHDARYGSAAYNDYYCHQLEELLTGYGDIFCVWFDNACGEGPNGIRQEYDFPRYIRLIRKLQPGAVIFNDYGPDTRWIGNEGGRSRFAEWSVVPSELCHLAQVQTGPGPLSGTLSGIYNPDPAVGSLSQILYSKGLVYCPSETDMSIRPGWFYHPEEAPHSLERLWDTYLRSVGGNSCLNLNIPPMPNGRFDERDVKRLAELGQKIRSAFASDLVQDASVATEELSPTQKRITLHFGQPITLSYLVLSEEIRYGQRVESFRVSAGLGSENETVIYYGTTIGHKKICSLDPRSIDHLSVTITAARGIPILNPIRVY